MECLFEAIIQFFGEFLIQFSVDLFSNAVTRGVPLPRVPHPREGQRRVLGTVGAVIVYLLVGIGAGYLSLVIIPHQVIRQPYLQIANLCLGPIAAGLLMQQIGRWLERHERGRTRLETFICGFALALAVAVIRYLNAMA